MFGVPCDISEICGPFFFFVAFMLVCDFLLHLCWFVTRVLEFGFFITTAGLFVGVVGVVGTCEYFKPLLSNLDEFK